MTLQPLLSVRFKSRTLNRVVTPEGVTLTVERYGFSTRGGPTQCVIRADGTEEAIVNLLGMIRDGVEVVDASADPVWWGYVHSVICYEDAIKFGLTMDEMGNKIKIIYLLQTINQTFSGGGSQQETAFATSTISATEYGTIEKRIRSGNLSTAAALAQRTKELNNRANPISVGTTAEVGAEGVYAIITCNGWVKTLEWRYWLNDSGNAAAIESNTTVTSKETQRLGQGSTLYTKFPTTSKITTQGDTDFGKLWTSINTFFFVEMGLGGNPLNNQTWTVTAEPDGPGVTNTFTPATATVQSFTTHNNVIGVGTKIWQTFALLSNNPFYAAAVDIFAGVGNATDNLVVSIYSVSGGLPNVQLATGTILNSELSSFTNWVTAVMTTPVLLSFGVTYGILIERSSGVFTTNTWFDIDVDTSLSYPRGSLQLYTNVTNGWKTRPTNADLIFRVAGLVQTTDQIVAIEASVGEFLTTTIIENASGLNTVPYADGTFTARQVIDNLCAAGTVNNRRLLQRVSADRELIISEEPVTGGADDYLLDRDGSIRYRTDVIIPPHRCPYAQWATVKPIRLEQVPTKQVFIDEVEYNAEQGRLKIIRTRDRREDSTVVTLGFT